MKRQKEVTQTKHSPSEIVKRTEKSNTELNVQFYQWTVIRDSEMILNAQVYGIVLNLQTTRRNELME